MSHIKVDQFIMNLVDFLSPDDYIRPNPLVNACAFILVLGITTMSTNLLAYKLILAMNFNASIKEKVIKYSIVILYGILMILLFFPLYNIIRTALNPQLIKSLLDNP